MSKAPTAFWRNADLRNVLIGELISDFGSEIGDLALPLFTATTLGATAAQMAGLLSAEYVPRIVVGLAASGWIDRVRRRPMLITTNLARFTLLSAVALAAYTQLLNIELLYAVAIILAGLDVVFTSTFAAYLPALVPTPMLTAANSARASSSAGASVLGPAIAGVLISTLGAAAAIAIDGVSFLASVMALTGVRAAELRPHPSTRRTSPLEAILQGWHAMLSEPTLRACALTAFTANFFYRVLMSVYVLAAPIARLFGVGKTMISAHVLFGILGIPLALSAAMPEYAAALVFASEFLQLGVNAVYMVNRTGVEQAISPPALRGRIQSSRNVLHAVAGVLGLAAGGALGTSMDPAAAIVVGVGGGLTSFIWLLLSPLPRLRNLPG